MTLFLIAIVITLFIAVALFIASTLAFLAIQVFYEIYTYSDSWIAYLAIIGMIALISYLLLATARIIAKRMISRQERKVKSGLLGFQFLHGISGKALLGIALYELLKFYLKRKKTN